MNASRREGPSGRASRGALAGAVLGLVVWLCAAFGLAGGLTWWQGLLAVVAGAAACAVGQVVARGIAGAAIGAVLGFVVGDVLVGGIAEAPRLRAALGGEAQVSGPTLEGKTLDVSELRGKVVLIDFWATWCPPCRAELPGLRDLYARHEEDGFRVVGVSLDNDAEVLARFVKEQKIPWPQIVFPEQGPDNPVARRYEVRSIPAKLLIDREGRIVADRELHGQRLERAVKNVLAGKAPDAAESGEVPASAMLGAAALAGCLAGMLVERRYRQGTRP